jgi:general secretion pathway protein H
VKKTSRKLKDNLRIYRVCPPDDRGFTLIELMIVLVIMGLMLAFAGPKVAKSLGGLSLKTTAKKVAGCLRYARSKAVNTSRQYNVIFDTEKNRVIVLSLPESAVSLAMNSNDAADDEEIDGEGPEETGEHKEPAREVKIFDLPEGITFIKFTIGDTAFDQEEGKGIYQMAFFPNGTSQGAEVIIADVRERAFLIGVDFLTGVVSVEEQTEE